jgi:D-amino-acid dehydrogenase
LLANLQLLPAPCQLSLKSIPRWPALPLLANTGLSNRTRKTTHKTGKNYSCVPERASYAGSLHAKAYTDRDTDLARHRFATVPALTMRVAIVGAGIIGVTTAYEISSDGHEVTVFERRANAGEETSFANAGVISPGYVAPWAAPGMSTKVLKQMLGLHASVRLSLPLTFADFNWMWRWWRACDPDTFRANRKRMQRLAFYSRQRLATLRRELDLDFEGSKGYMVVLRTDQDRHLIEPGLAILRESGVRFNDLDMAEARAIEPALNPDLSFAGGIHLPDDEIGNCRQFTLLLKSAATHAGVKFRFGTTVCSVTPGDHPSLKVHGQSNSESFDAIILCAGVASADLLRDIGIAIPLVPVYGYSISAPVREPLNAPKSAIMDERFKVAISRLGNRVRVAGSAELGGEFGKFRKESIRTLYKVLLDWFPGAAVTTQGVQQWKGARPMLPEGPPVLGRSPRPGIWLNLGHGSSGWAMACGCARVLADEILGRKPELDLEGLRVDRYLR